MIFWIFALMILAISDPHQPHLSLCLFKLAGIPYCPGCGLGHAISYLFRGEFISSFNTHPLALPALFFILLRLYRLIFHKPVFTLKIIKYGLYVHDPSES